MSEARTFVVDVGRGVGGPFAPFPFGRLDIRDDSLTVRSWPRGLKVRPRTIRASEIKAISVVQRRRWEEPTLAILLSGDRVDIWRGRYMLAPIVQALRSHGYEVSDSN